MTTRRAKAVLRRLAGVRAERLGARASAWPPFLAALPALLRADSARLLDAVGRVDVMPALSDLAAGAVEAPRLERALVTLWLALAGHPGLTAPLALPGPFREGAVDPHAPRVIALGNVRALVATARGPVVLGRDGRMPLESFVVAALPAVEGTVIVDEQLAAPPSDVTARVRIAFELVKTVLPGGRLERVTVGAGSAANGEARIVANADAADLIASAQAAFIRALADVEPLLQAVGRIIENGRRLDPADVLARACGNTVALPWCRDREGTLATIAGDLDSLGAIADLSPAAEELVAALRAQATATPAARRRALLVNVDVDDFVYSYHFGRSIERRCVERGWCVDRVEVDGTAGRDLMGELGHPLAAPVGDGTEFLVTSNDDPNLAAILRHVSGRHYEAVVANVRPRLFYDLVEANLLHAPTLVWDRHLHDGLEGERGRRGVLAEQARTLPIRLWSLLGGSGDELERGNEALLNAGLDRVTPRPWPMDLEYFRSNGPRRPDLLFAGGDSGRDWPLLLEAIRDLPIDMHLVTRKAPQSLPPRVHIDPRLTMGRFRDAMAAATVTAIPLLPGAGASGLTVLTIAMALGVAVVTTRSDWIGHYVSDGEEALIVPPGDVAAFRAALVRLYEDTDLRTRLVANARRRVAAMCDLETFTRDMFATLP